MVGLTESYDLLKKDPGLPRSKRLYHSLSPPIKESSCHEFCSCMNLNVAKELRDIP
jgi:hypothetical protein